MGSLVTFKRRGPCLHPVVQADGDSYRERSHRLPTCIECGATLSWEEIDLFYEEQP